MKLTIMILRRTVLATILLTAFGDDNDQGKSGPSPSVGQGISSPTHTQSTEDTIRKLFDEFSHLTSLHESFVRHPMFSHYSGGGDSSKPFSTWAPFRSFARWSPRYEVIDDTKTFQVKVDVSGFYFHEIDVELEHGGRVLSISGTKETNFHNSGQPTEEKKHTAMGEKTAGEGGQGETLEYSSHTATSFSQKFTLDPSVDTIHMTANLVGGTLEIRAPRKQGAWNGRHIPITQFDDDVWEQLLNDNDGEADNIAESSTATME